MEKNRRTQTAKMALTLAVALVILSCIRIFMATERVAMIVSLPAGWTRTALGSMGMVILFWLVILSYLGLGLIYNILRRAYSFVNPKAKHTKPSKWIVWFFTALAVGLSLRALKILADLKVFDNFSVGLKMVVWPDTSFKRQPLKMRIERKSYHRQASSTGFQKAASENED